MPTYAYACTACSHAFEAVQSFSDDSLTSCPECEGRLRKVFSSVGVVFKGSGFYRNDARAGAKSSTLSPAPSTPSTSDSSTASSSTPAPATPTPAPAAAKPAASS
ncbi:FmdB family zinc ribbon protein [Cellulomonas sp. URHD0024]|uniref:FmdB family zinc ribbon protein n=1 Tax=Cellulomonas sp. URHD0024 TaxID=1302620 RepID=UPI00040CDE30|nr:FmdB family zinc ribbon protein [Cellulomonas sp. URHD0024]